MAVPSSNDGPSVLEAEAGAGLQVDGERGDGARSIGAVVDDALEDMEAEQLANVVQQSSAVIFFGSASMMSE